MYEFLNFILGLLKFFGIIGAMIVLYYALVIFTKILIITYKSLKSWMQDYGVLFLWLGVAMCYQTYKTRNKDTWLLLIFIVVLIGISSVILWRGLL